MLFRLVCGPELEQVFTFVQSCGGVVPKAMLEDWVVQRPSPGSSSANLEEALLVLRTAQFLQGGSEIVSVSTPLPFKLAFLERLSEFATGRNAGNHALDGWFLRLLDQLFVAPDTLLIQDMHRAANRLGVPAPLSDEKLNAWRRVMEWLGVGMRVNTGFIATYSPELVLSLLKVWSRSEGPLEDFLVTHVGRFVPCMAEHGDLPQALSRPLVWLEKRGLIELTARQDHPGKAYLEQRRVKWIRIKGVPA